MLKEAKIASGQPDWSPRIITSASNDEQLIINAVAGDNSATFVQVCMAMIVYNDGPNPIHYRRDAVATVNYFMIPAKAWMMIDVPVTIPHFFLAAGHTATIYIYGVY